MDLELAKARGDMFHPDSLTGFLGKYPRVAAKVKTQPRFFCVEEQAHEELRCTATADSDLGDGRLFGADEDSGGDYVAVTMVKRCETTPSGIEKAKALIGGSESSLKATYAGLKDRWALTAQRIVIQGATYGDVVRACMPDMAQLDEYGVFLKDPARTDRPLKKGHLLGNNFTLRVAVPGMSAKVLKAYVDERLTHLTRHDRIMFPNFFGKQRLGMRQNLFGIGYDHMVFGPEAGIKRFLTECSPNENPKATEVRQKLAVLWQAAEEQCKRKGGCVAHQEKQLRAMKEILEARAYDKPVYDQYNMTIELRIVTQLLVCRDYWTTMRELYDDFSLWTGAYQGFWFNQILGKVLSGEKTLMNQDRPDARIPLFMDEQRALRFYRAVEPDALPPRLDNRVRSLFLTTKGSERGPRRPLFTEVVGLEYNCEDGFVNMRFFLEKGAYATTFLLFLFQLEGDRDNKKYTGLEDATSLSSLMA